MKRHLGLVTLAVAVVIAAVIYACVNRYSVYRDGSSMMRLDRWTGQAKLVP